MLNAIVLSEDPAVGVAVQELASASRQVSVVKSSERPNATPYEIAQLAHAGIRPVSEGIATVTSIAAKRGESFTVDEIEAILKRAALNDEQLDGAEDE